MKKMMKKLIAMAAALVMIVTLLPAVGANAEGKTTAFDPDETGSITINKTTQDPDTPLANAKFEIWKVIGFATNASGEYVVTESKITDIANGTKLDDIDMSRFTSTSNLANGNYGASVQSDTTNDQGIATFTNLTTGIYLVKETQTPDNNKYIASLPFFVSIPSTAGRDENGNMIGSEDQAGKAWIYDITATPKNSEIGGEKEIVKGEDITYTDLEGNASAALGDTVGYKITVRTPAFANEVPDEDKGLEIQDTISGLTTVKENGKTKVSVQIDNVDVPAQYYTVEDTANGFKVVFTDDFLEVDNYKNKDLVITYSATVNNDAIIGNGETGGNENSATVSFGNNPQEITQKPKVYVYGLQMTKQGQNNDVMDDVVFELYKDSVSEDNLLRNKYGADDEGKVYVNSNNLLTIKGMPAGTYVLKEVKTKSGYTLLTNPVIVTIATSDDSDPNVTVKNPKVTVTNGTVSADASTVTDGKNSYFAFTVENQKGFTLPATGGMGTYLFTIGGIVIMAGAAFALIAMKKRA